MFLGMLNYNLMMKGCGLPAGEGRDRSGKPGEALVFRFCAGLAAHSPDYS
jgi:hypothetical protein